METAYCPCEEHNIYCGKKLAEGTCRLDQGHKGDCTWGIPRRPSPEMLRAKAKLAHDRLVAKEGK